MRRPLAPLLAAVVATAVLAAPAGATAPDPVHPAVAAKGQRQALFFGDSYFVGGGCSPDERRDMAYLAGTRLGYQPTVRGAGGTGFASANPDYGLPAYLAQIHQGALDLSNPALVVIEGGSNDLSKPVGRIKRNAAKVLKIARGKYPDALLVLVGPMDARDGYADTTPVRDGLAAVAKKLHVPFVDDMTWLQDKPNQLCSDYDHPTYAAHQRLGRKLAAALRSLGA